MDSKIEKALQNLKNNQHSEEDLKLLRLASANEQIFIGGDVQNSVIIAGNGNTVQLTSRELKLLRIDNSLSSRHQLPQPPVDFVGRTDELNAILMDIREKSGTIISGLVGMGGIGKTALGLVIAHHLIKQYPYAQFYMDMRGTSAEPLQPIDMMKHVVQSLHPTLDLHEVTEDQMRGLYRSKLAKKKVLLFLDNAHDASQITPLIPPASCLVIITSRGHFPVPGLHSIQLGTLKEEEAIRLLIEICSRISQQNAKGIAQLCGYLPIALRLAANYLQIHTDWTTEEYILQLSDRTRRLRALRVADADLSIEITFEQSYQQLSKDEQRYWSTLAIFPSSFKRDAIAAVWNLEQEPTRDLLGKLLQYSLLEYDQATDRYRLHDLMRDFANTKLTDDDQVNALLNYLRHYQNVWATAEEQYAMSGDNIKPALLSFDSEFAHIENAYQWALTNADSNILVSTILSKIPVSLSIVHLRVPPKQRIEWFRVALAAAEKLEDLSGQTILLGNIGRAYVHLAAFHEAIGYFEQAMEIARRIGDRENEGFWLGEMGVAYADLGQPLKALEYLNRGLELARLSGNKLHESDCLNYLGKTYSSLGELHKSIEYLLQALNLTRQVGDQQKEGVRLANIGAAYINLGEQHKALESLGRALDIAREVGDQQREEYCLGTSGFAHMYLGEFDQAIDFLEKGRRIAHEIGNRDHEQNWTGNIGIIHLELGEPVKALEYLEPAMQIAREIGDRTSQGEWLGNIGMTYAVRGENQEAKEHLEQALAIAREVGGRWQVAQWQSQLGELYVNMNEPMKARVSLDEALKLSKEFGMRILEANSLFVYAKLYKSEHNKELALQYAREARAAFESLQSPEAKNVDEFIKSLEE